MDQNPTDTEQQVTDLEYSIISNTVRHVKTKVLTEFVEWFLRRGDELAVSCATVDSYTRGRINDEEQEDLRPLVELVGVFGDEKAKAILSVTLGATCSPLVADADPE